MPMKYYGNNSEILMKHYGNTVEVFVKYLLICLHFEVILGHLFGKIVTQIEKTRRRWKG